MDALDTILNDSMTHIAQQRDKAEKIYKSFNPKTDAQFDAAYQIWQDLDRAYAELERTKFAIDEGYI